MNPLKTPMTVPITSSIFLPPSFQKTAADRHMLESFVSVVPGLISQQLLDEHVFQDCHLHTVEDRALMSADKRFRIAGRGERGLRGLGEVLENLLPARHEPLGNIDGKNEPIGLLHKFREVQSTDGVFLEPTSPLPMSLALNLLGDFTEARIGFAKGPFEGKGEGKIVQDLRSLGHTNKQTALLPVGVFERPPKFG